MKFQLFLFALGMSLITFSQPWQHNLPNNKTKNELTLSDYQNAFELYWANKTVVNGKYTEDGLEKKAYGWKQFKRWENYWNNRVNS